MRAAILLIAIYSAQAGVVSRDWSNGKLVLHLDDATAEIEFISGTAFRYSRGATIPIRHEKVVPELEDTRDAIDLRGRYITIGIDKVTANLRVSVNDETISTLQFEKSDLRFAPLGKVFGLAGPGDALRFFFTSGYGIFIRSPRDCTFDLDHGLVHVPGNAMEVIFYFGPTAKEIFEQHQNVVGKTEITTPTSDHMQMGASPLPKMPLDQLVETLSRWSLSAVLYPAMELTAGTEKRTADLAAMLPLVYGDTISLDRGTREKWTPYLITYLREAYDRGYPLVRPLPMQFSRDKNLYPQLDLFMLGDEVLLAPMITTGTRRSLRLPRGLWTDLRTNVEHKGNQTVEVDAPMGHVPMFARNGALFPLAAKNAMELHYFPSLAGEFFLWEPEKKDNSQFHAAPAGEFTRVEIESLVARTYEWVIHHSRRPTQVGEDGATYKQVRQRASLKAGNWWYDAAHQNLHVLASAEAGVDKIVNISFGE
jgi:alpha-glucosidase (family GH31 glycosyl hydrolase)